MREFLLFGLLAWTSAFALSDGKGKPADEIIDIEGDLLVAKSNIHMVGIIGSPENLSKAYSSRDAAKKRMLDDMPAALSRAKGHEDLVKAVKEYYVAAVAYLDGALGSSANAARLESDLASKEAALDLELQLAGFATRRSKVRE